MLQISYASVSLAGEVFGGIRDENLFETSMP